MTIRRAVVEDSEALSLLLVSTWHATYDRLYGEALVKEITSKWHSSDVLASQIADKSLVTLVAERHGEIIGTATGRPGCSASLPKLVRLYVAPKAQGGGVGFSLHQAVVEAMGSPVDIELEVEPSNDRAVAFYGRLGYVMNRPVAQCGGKADLPAIVMRRSKV